MHSKNGKKFEQKLTVDTDESNQEIDESKSDEKIVHRHAICHHEVKIIEDSHCFVHESPCKEIEHTLIIEF